MSGPERTAAGQGATASWRPPLRTAARLIAACLLGGSLSLSMVALTGLARQSEVEELGRIVDDAGPGGDTRRALRATLELALARQGRTRGVQRLVLVVGLGVAVALALLIVYDLASREANPLPTLLKEIASISSGSVSIVTNAISDLSDDVEAVLGFLALCEKEGWEAAGRYSDEHAIPAVLESLRGNLDDLGPILRSIDDRLCDLVTRLQGGCR